MGASHGVNRHPRAAGPDELTDRFERAVQLGAQFWDGRAKDLQQQAEGPVANPIEMGSVWEEVVDKVGKNEEYAAIFGKLYEDGVTENNITDAIAEYEKSLVTPSRFDKYLRGDQSAITDEEKQGYALFKETGCTACHMGINVGGSTYQKMRLIKDCFTDRGTELTEADLGRFNVTKQAQDRHFLKVPTLRNVELTPPYLTDEQAQSIVVFLKSLTGELPDHARVPGAGDRYGYTLTPRKRVKS